ncbi:MAG: ribonuclease H [Candidatus Paceibacterota bacterium]|jgi:ribonuclease HI
MNEDKIIIYSDGAARGNPGLAGWGSVFILGKKVFEIGGREKHATNNQMELTAAIEALKYLKRHSHIAQGKKIEFFCDSKYVILGITEWIQNWMKNNWRNAAKKPVLNRNLWEELYFLNKEFNPKWNYVEGHSGDKYNDRADLIATSFADDEPVELF